LAKGTQSAGRSGDSNNVKSAWPLHSIS
jgi:hypothetical protein